MAAPGCMIDAAEGSGSCADNACGGAGRDNDGGLGGQTLGTLAVTPGAVLQIYVGGQATDVGNITPAPGGFNGGGAGGQYGAGGGGASDVRVGGNAWANRVAVAGGGGGGNTGCPDYGFSGRFQPPLQRHQLRPCRPAARRSEHRPADRPPAGR